MVNSKRHVRLFRAVTMLLILIVVLAVPAVINAVDAPIDLSKDDCALTVNPCYPTNTVLKENTIIDLYLVANAAEVEGYDTYDYDLVDPFKSLDLSDEWAKVTEDAGKIFFDNYKSSDWPEPTQSGKATEAIGDLNCGLYLIVARAEDLEDYVRTINETSVTVSRTPTDDYLYSPALVSIPTKDPIEDENGKEVINTANPGPWKYDFEITLKPVVVPRYGYLVITKDLVSFKADEKTTFVFSVKYKEGDEDIEKVYTLDFLNEYYKTTKQIRFPAGTEVTVEEIHDGIAYEPVGATKAETIIIADQTQSCAFKNKYVGGGGGYGILNTFSYNGQTWEWVPVPEVASTKEVTAE